MRSGGGARRATAGWRVCRDRLRRLAEGAPGRREAAEEKIGRRSGLPRWPGASGDAVSAYPEVSWADETIGCRARYADIIIAGPEVLAGETLKGKVIEGALFSSG
ncbi:hypothetical protein [Mesorhizobium sp. B2-4-11]|uniref:hypothetical protein n=1 Tax=Mesorhizobium sp. B2-4-11 TaxID=2589938 RepID=UPI001FEFF7D3|nr:hypothetical protein [Mesorhizobium sp. B2-4-11]